MNHSVTIDDVKHIYRENVAQLVGGSRKTPAEARQGTRTEVHALLQEQVPCPYRLAPPARAYAPHEGKLRNQNIADRKATLIASIPDALVLESERARSGPDGGHVDAVHYVQKQHGKALWVEADRLVVEAIGGAS